MTAKARMTVKEADAASVREGKKIPEGIRREQAPRGVGGCSRTSVKIIYCFCWKIKNLHSALLELVPL